MSLGHGASIIRSGLVLHLDAANPKSYSGSGTTWNDLSGNGNTGTLVNGPTYDTSNGGSIVFDGTNDYASVLSLSGSFASFTIIVWFFPTSVINYKNVIGCNVNSYTSGNIGPRLEMNTLGNLAWVYSNVTDNGGVFYSQSVISNGMQNNVWHCAAITYNSITNTSYTYYNGNDTNLVRTTTGSPTGFVGVINDISIGYGFRFGTGSDRYFVGKIPLTQIYNRSLSATEIQKNFEALRGRYGI